MSGQHTPGPWFTYQPHQTIYIEARLRGSVLQEVAAVGPTEDPDQQDANALLIAASPDYHDAAHWIREAVANNAAPVNPLAALEEMALAGMHVTLDAGLVLDLLKAHAKATGATP